MKAEQLPPHRGTSIIRAYAWHIAGVGFLIMVGSAVIYSINRTWKVHAEVGVGVGFVLLLAAVVLRPEAVRMVLTGRSVKYASNALVMTLAFVGIVGLLNLLAFRNNIEYDFTETAQFTLSEQTLKVLEKMDRPVHVIGFFQTGDPRRDIAEDYLERSSRFSPYLSYEFHDPIAEPTLAQSYDLENYGLVFTSGSKRHEANTVDEETITSGLIRVTSDKEKRVYFLTGHGGPNPLDPSPDGYSEVRSSLERENYIVDTLNLATNSDVELDASSTLVVSGVERELLEAEAQFISEWVINGGKLMLLVDPLDPIPLQTLLKHYGLLVGQDLVADMDNHLVGLAPTSPLITQYPFHEITQGLSGIVTFFPLARSVSIEMSAGDTFINQPLLTTSPNSWAEADLEGAELVYNADEDVAGPIHIGTATEDAVSGTRLVVLGSADFVTNKVVNEVGNRDLFMNTVNWLSEEEDLISIRAKREPSRVLFLTPLQNTITIVTTLIVIPVAFLFAGIFVWWKRR